MSLVIQSKNYKIYDNGVRKSLYFNYIKKNNYESIFENTLKNPTNDEILKNISEIQIHEYLLDHIDFKMYEKLIEIIDKYKDNYYETQICIYIITIQECDFIADGKSNIKSDKVFFKINIVPPISMFHQKHYNSLLDYFPNIFVKTYSENIESLNNCINPDRDNQLIIVQNDESDFLKIKFFKNSIYFADSLITNIETFLGNPNNKLTITTKLTTTRERYKKYFDFFYSKLCLKLEKFIIDNKLLVSYEIKGVLQDLNLLMNDYEMSTAMINSKLKSDKHSNILNTYNNNITEINQIYDIFIKRYYSSLIETYQHKIFNNANITDEIKKKADDYIDSIFTYIFKDINYKTQSANNSHMKTDFVKKMINYVIKYRESVINNSFPQTRNFISFHGTPTSNIVKLPNDCLLLIMTPLNRYTFQDERIFNTVLPKLQFGFYDELFKNPLCHHRDTFNDVLTDATVIFGGQYYFDINLEFSTNKNESFYNQNGIYSSRNNFKRERVICGNISNCIRENNLNGIIILHCCRSIDDLPIEDSVLMYRYENLMRILNKSVYLQTEKEYSDCDKITHEQNVMLQPEKTIPFLDRTGNIKERDKYINKILNARSAKLINNSQSISLELFKRLNIPNSDKFVELINKIGSNNNINNKDIFDELDILTNLKYGDVNNIKIYTKLINYILLIQFTRFFNRHNFLSYMFYNLQYIKMYFNVDQLFNSITILNLNNLNIDQTHLEILFNLNTPYKMQYLTHLYINDNTFKYLPITFLDLEYYPELIHISCDHIDFNNLNDINVVNYYNLADNFQNYFNPKYGSDSYKYINFTIVENLKELSAKRIDLNLNKLKTQLQTRKSRKTFKQSTKTTKTTKNTSNSKTKKLTLIRQSRLSSVKP